MNKKWKDTYDFYDKYISFFKVGMIIQNIEGDNKLHDYVIDKVNVKEKKYDKHSLVMTSLEEGYSFTRILDYSEADPEFQFINGEKITDVFPRMEKEKELLKEFEDEYNAA